MVGVEHIPQLCELSRRNLEKDPVHRKMLEEGTIEVVQSDGRMGYAEAGRFLMKL